jgi:hypothetical protein
MQLLSRAFDSSAAYSSRLAVGRRFGTRLASQFSPKRHKHVFGFAGDHSFVGVMLACSSEGLERLSKQSAGWLQDASSCVAGRHI